MRRMIIIDDCDKCPNMSIKEGIQYCKALVIGNYEFIGYVGVSGIPDWCPLLKYSG